MEKGKNETSKNVIEYTEDLKENIIKEIQDFQSKLTGPVAGIEKNSDGYANQTALDLHKAKSLLKIQNILNSIDEDVVD